MSEGPLQRRAGIVRWLLGWRLLSLAGIVFFACLVARFYDSDTGFTSLISIGSKMRPSLVTDLRAVPHYEYEDSYGYDGVYYVQIALHPTLNDPELSQGVDNLHYRAKRILLSWTAWAVGLGRPEWVVQAYPLLNIFCWLGLACLLWRWLPPDSLNNVLRWAGVMFSHGVCMSVRHSLVDGPSLLLTALAVMLWEKNRRSGAVGVLAAAILTKETSLLAGVLFAEPPPRGWRWWLRTVGFGLLAAIPLVVWLVCLHLRLGPAHESGFNNFTWPLAGLAQKWGVVAAELVRYGRVEEQVLALLTTLALTVQIGFFVSRFWPREIWWRVGVVFAGLGFFVSQPVWEGYPGAATRVLLPMTLAFNILVPRGRRWLLVLLAGNLSVFAAIAEFHPPSREFYRLAGEKRLKAAVSVQRGAGWYQSETDGRITWRWARQHAQLQLTNHSAEPVEITMSCSLSGITNRHFGFRVNGNQIWDTPLLRTARPHRFPPFILPPGTTTLEFATDQAVMRQNNMDPRELSQCVYNLVITVAPVPVRSQP